jgi:carbamoyltransferase
MHSIGILYSLMTHYLGLVPFMDEYKVMGLAPYGDPGRYYAQFAELVHLREDGTYTVPLMARDYSAAQQETHEGVFAELVGRFGPARLPGEPLTGQHADLAAALQAITEASLLHVLRAARQSTGHRRLCLAGGVALNCTANGLVARSGLFDDVFVQPAASDDGTALGAALQAEPHLTGHVSPADMPYWGPGFTDEELAGVAGCPEGCAVRHFGGEDADRDLVRYVARLLADGQIVAWFQGRMEFGPRALGNRSILADPRHAGMRDRLNAVVKDRESFRPFAPAVRAEDAGRYFEIDAGAEDIYAHMLFVARTRQEYRDQLGAVTHVDGTARVQTVRRFRNERFWSLITAFGEETGMPVLLNTSFNLKGQPIIAMPDEAVRTFLRSRIDVLAIGRTVVTRQEVGHG